MLKKISQKKFEKGVDKTDELCYNQDIEQSGGESQWITKTKN